MREVYLRDVLPHLRALPDGGHEADGLLLSGAFPSQASGVAAPFLEVMRGMDRIRVSGVSLPLHYATTRVLLAVAIVRASGISIPPGAVATLCEHGEGGKWVIVDEHGEVLYECGHDLHGVDALLSPWDNERGKG